MTPPRELESKRNKPIKLVCNRCWKDISECACYGDRTFVEVNEII